MTPLLQKHWPSLAVPAGSRVFVPLAGKSLDLLWFAAQGHRVLGVELSQLAVEQFFAENALEPEIHATAYGTHYTAGEIELICGDAFALDRAVLADCDAVFDRAALIALPAELRQRYVGELYARLPRGLPRPADHPRVSAAREGRAAVLGRRGRGARAVRPRLDGGHAGTARHPRRSNRRSWKKA